LLLGEAKMQGDSRAQQLALKTASVAAGQSVTAATPGERMLLIAMHNGN
jgi:hypothetical protein